jgi:hypothetical protein
MRDPQPFGQWDGQYVAVSDEGAGSDGSANRRRTERGFVFLLIRLHARFGRVTEHRLRRIRSAPELDVCNIVPRARIGDFAANAVPTRVGLRIGDAFAELAAGQDGYTLVE